MDHKGRISRGLLEGKEADLTDQKPFTMTQRASAEASVTESCLLKTPESRWVCLTDKLSQEFEFLEKVIRGKIMAQSFCPKKTTIHVF